MTLKNLYLKGLVNNISIYYLHFHLWIHTLLVIYLKQTIFFFPNNQPSDSLLSKHGGSGSQDGGLYGKAEDDDLERFMTPVANQRPTSSKTPGARMLILLPYLHLEINKNNDLSFTIIFIHHLLFCFLFVDGTSMHTMSSRYFHTTLYVVDVKTTLCAYRINTFIQLYFVYK